MRLSKQPGVQDPAAVLVVHAVHIPRDNAPANLGEGDALKRDAPQLSSAFATAAVVAPVVGPLAAHAGVAVMV